MKTHENNHFSWISFVEPIFEDWLFEHLENHIGDVMVIIFDQNDKIFNFTV
jgi:hypothetical protein